MIKIEQNFVLLIFKHAEKVYVLVHKFFATELWINKISQGEILFMQFLLYWGMNAKKKLQEAFFSWKETNNTLFVPGIHLIYESMMNNKISKA